MIITDNGSDMVKAFRNDALTANEDLSDDEDVGETEENEDEDDDFCVDNGMDFDTRNCSMTLHLHMSGNELVTSLIAFSWSSKSLKMTH